MTDAIDPTDEADDGDGAGADAGADTGGGGADGDDVRQALSGLQRARAPSSFAQDVTATIHKRSAGRFFGRRTFGDRVPFGALLIVALLGLGVIAWVIHGSATGSLRVDHEHDPPHGSAAVVAPP
jgi:hypothetical protein